MPFIPMPGKTGNRLLDLLPSEELERLAPLLQPTTMVIKQLVHQFEDEVNHIYFPKTALLSALTVLQEDEPVEAAPIGWDGFVGISTALGVEASPHRVICQVAGETLRMPASRFTQVMGQCPTLTRLVMRYAAFLLRQSSQMLACNALHTVESRACRWLLLMHDHVRRDEFPLTHEFMAYMLGVRRQTVTLVSGALQNAGLIGARRGVVMVLDRDGLEEASCECYQIIRDYYDRVVH